MKYKYLYFLLIFINSCSYPDIDTVPNFQAVELSKEEAIDLCNLTSTNDADLLKNCLIFEREILANEIDKMIIK